MEIQIGKAFCGFEVERIEEVSELSGRAYFMTHKKSKAQLVFLENEDPQMSFTITFKTPAADDTGVFHILEHSMLCGSRKFPVKKPFTTMLKTSMQTFLNAFTGADFTMYPVASTNQQDLLNLMDVYMDAVCHPLLLEDETIFLQEGWHLEASGGKRENLAYNGVVYNEMKGALSSPVRYALKKLQCELFPDGTYGKESGGDPRYITDLSYEDYVDAYRRHYRLDNSLICLYGNMDAETVLSFLDQQYLSQDCGWDEGVIGAPNPCVFQEPRVSLEETYKVSGTQDNSMILYGSVLRDAKDIYSNLMAGVLCDVLFGTVEAPVRKAFFEKGLCGEVGAANYNPGSQGHVIVFGLQALEENRKAFVELIKSECTKVLESGKLPELADATVAAMEFSWRQGPDCPAGISFAQDVAACVFHGQDPLKAARYEDFLAYHKEVVGQGAYERLLKELFIESNHEACIALVPDMEFDSFFEGEHLEKESERLSDEAIVEVDAAARFVHETRMAPDAPENLATLPILSRSDLNPEGVRPPRDTSDLNGTSFVRIKVPSHKIDYVSYYFDLSDFTVEDLQYLSVACVLAGELPVGDMTAAQVQLEGKRLLGELDCDIVCSERWDSLETACLLSIDIDMLDRNREEALSLAWNILENSDFTDLEKIRQIVDLVVLGYEQTVSNNAANIAVGRVRAAHIPAFAVTDATDGLEGYRFAKRLQQEEDLELAAARMGGLFKRVLSRRPVLVCAVCEEDAVEAICNTGSSMTCAEPAGELGRLQAQGTEMKSEGWSIPAAVAANAMMMVPRNLEHLKGRALIAEKALNWDYLWDVVRVSGGAYGVNASFDKHGRIVMASARDPRIDGTFQDFAAAAQWLATHEFTEPEVDGFVISTISKADKPIKPEDRITLYAATFASGRPREDKKQMRADVLASTAEDLAIVGRALMEYQVAASVCSVAGKAQLEASEMVEYCGDLIGLGE